MRSSAQLVGTFSGSSVVSSVIATSLDSQVDFTLRSVRQRVRSNLEVDDFRVGPFSRFTMEGGASPPGGPHSFALPSRLGVVKAPIHSFGVEPQGIGHAQYGELAVDQGD